MHAQVPVQAWDRDQDLARAARAAEGEDTTLRALIGELKPRIWRRAWTIARPDHHRAEDLAQEGLVCALRPVALRQYAGSAPLLGYLSFIAQRRMLAVVRTAREKAWQSRATFDPVENEVAGEADPTFGSVERSLDAARIAAALEGLPPETALLVRLKASGAPNDEIAALLDIPVGTVKSRFSRACRHLRTELEEAAR